MMREDFQQSRFNQRTKRRKTNLILNGLIGIVLVLIIVVSAFIFMGNDDKATTEKETEQSVETSNSVAEEEESTNEETDGSNSETSEDDSSNDSSSSADEDSSEEAIDNKEAIVTEGGADSNVVQTIVNPNWKPIGTVQTGEHTTVYEGVDWDEMVAAIEYATGLSADNMTIKFLGNDGHNKSKGTVFSKDRTQIYRVSIEWVDGEGWKPTLVEELQSIE